MMRIRMMHHPTINPQPQDRMTVQDTKGRRDLVAPTLAQGVGQQEGTHQHRIHLHRTQEEVGTR